MELKVIHSINFLSVQETQIENSSDVPVNLYQDHSPFNRVVVDLNGRSGGLFCAWNSLVFKNVHVIKNPNFIVVSGDWEGMHGTTNLINIYAPINASARANLWLHIKSFINSLNGCWLLMGDFNEIRHKYERFLNHGCDHLMEDFNMFSF